MTFQDNLKRYISKLPVRQITVEQYVSVCYIFSKLPVRQITYFSDDLSRAMFSKLPVRQITHHP